MDATIANYPEQRFTLRNGDTVYSAASEELVPPSVRQATSQFPHCVRTHLLVYYEDEPGRRMAIRRLTRGEGAARNGVAGKNVGLSDKYVTTLIGATTLATVGTKVTPHLFRTAAASGAAIYGGDNPYLSSGVLHHSDPRVTEHYNRATSLTAAESFRQLIRQYKKK